MGEVEVDLVLATKPPGVEVYDGNKASAIVNDGVP